MKEDEHAKKRAWIIRLISKRRSASVRSETQQIREGLSLFIKQAVAEKDVHTLALMAGWFVLVSEDITINRFKEWMEEGQEPGKAEPPSNGRGGRYG